MNAKHVQFVLKLRYLIWLVFFSLITSFLNASGTVVVRPAQMHELNAIMELDRRVAFEFFKPLYLQSYAHLPCGQDPDFYLERELGQDREWFAEFLQGGKSGDYRLLVACDVTAQRPIGLLLFHRKDELSLELDLLLVDKAARGLGVGKSLILQALATFEDITICDVYPFRFGNDATLAFYEKMGFVRLGLGPIERMSSYGIPYAELYFYYRLTLTRGLNYAMVDVLEDPIHRSFDVATKKSKNNLTPK